jgi:hypothetical protein
MQIKSYLQLLCESYALCLISTVFGKENLFIQLGRWADRIDERRYENDRL